MPPQKRLRLNAKLAYLCHFNYIDPYDDYSETDVVVTLCRGLMISQSFLNSYFHETEVGNLEITMNDGNYYALIRGTSLRWQEKFLSPDGLATLLELADIERLHLCFNVHILNKKFVESCTKFCRALKRSRTLKGIELSMNNEGSFRPKWTSPVLADLLPRNKIQLLQCRSDNAINFKGHAIQTLRITDYRGFFGRAYEKIEKSLLFKMNVKRLHFNCAREFGLLDIPRIKPLRPNPILQELVLPLRFIIFTYEYYKSKAEWFGEYIRQFERSFECLEVVGSQLKIELVADGSHMYRLKDSDDVESMIDKALWCLHTIIDNASHHEISITQFKLSWSPVVISKEFFLNHSQNLAKRLKLDTQPSYEKNISYHEQYKETEIRLELKCCAEGVYRNPDPLFRSKRPELNYHAYSEWL